MNDFEKGQKAIKTILKYGDLYDVIAQSCNAKVSSNSFLRANLLLFSRILYGVLLAGEKISSYFSPVEKVKEAQDDIRSLLGVNVDVIKEKGKPGIIRGVILPGVNNVSLLYDDRHAFIDEYISNLQKILSFCIIHKIEYVYLYLDDLGRLFNNLNLGSYSYIPLNFILNEANLGFEEYEEEDYDEKYLILNQEKLQSLISQLMGYKIDRSFVIQLGRQIDDPAIKMAINQFSQYGNLNDLKNTLVTRLCHNINSDSSYKTRSGEKAGDMVSISGEFIKVISIIEGSDEPLKTNFMLLCEYLGYPNYEALLNSLKHLDDDKDRILMAALHLYINNIEKVPISSSHQNFSLYDRLYENYLARKNNKKTPKVYYYPRKSIKFLTNAIAMILALCLTAASVAAGMVSLFGIDFLRNNFFKKAGKESNIMDSYIELIKKPYIYSWGVEKALIQRIKDELDSKSKPKLFNGITNATRNGLLDLDLGNNDKKVAGQVYSLDDHYELPEYFAFSYGASSTYHKGNITYDLKEQMIDFAKMQPLDSVLKVETYFSNQELCAMISDNAITIPMALYPLDKNYILTKVVIYDQDRVDSSIKLDAYRVDNYNGSLSAVEVDVLKRMKHPVVEYYYGINDLFYNSFVRNIEKDGTYLETNEEEMHDIITNGLGLSTYASYEEIYEAIKSKKYSLDPFGDSDVKANTKKMDEKEFMGTVASMDYLICNLAATLAVEVNQDLTYVVGFMSDDDVITYGEAHAWAVSPSGEIIEVTPTNIEEDDEKDEAASIIKNVLEWAMQNKIPFIIVLGLISSIIYKLLGKRIIFSIKVMNLNRLLNSSQMAEAYSYLNESRFGGINLPKEHTALEYLDMLEDDFEGYKKDELQELLKRLKEGQNSSKPLAIKVVKRVPFIKKNEKQITRKLNKK